MKYFKFYLICIVALLMSSFNVYANSLHNEPCQNNYLSHLNPVAFYGLDDVADIELISGTQAVVFGNDANPLVVNGARSFTGNAIDFRNTDNSLYYPVHQELANAGNIDTQNGISVSFWFKADTYQNNTRFISASTMEFAANNANGINGLLWQNNLVSTALFDGNWHHYMAVLEYDGGENNLRSYVDGVLKSQMSVFINNSNQLSVGQNMFVGARSNGTLSSIAELDDIAIFDYPLNDNEINAVYNGGVWVKEQEEVYVFNTYTNTGLVPPNAAVQWSQVSGPGTTNFTDATDFYTEMSFDATGVYVLSVNVIGYGSREVTITVLPPEPPVITQQNSRQIPDTFTFLELSPEISIPGRNDIAGVTYNWTKVSGPSIVNFQNGNQANALAQFGAEGIYTIRLEATYDGLTGQNDITVLVGAEKETHYALLLEPLYLIGMEGLADKLPGAVKDLTGHTGAFLNDIENDILPQINVGARPYTGYCWDFQNTEQAIYVNNRGQIADVGNINKTDGLSVGFWVKGNTAQISGRMAVLPYVNIYPIQFGNNYALRWFHYASGEIIDTPANINLFDDNWHHIVYVFDYDENTDNVKTYIDGSLESQATFDLTKAFNRNELRYAHEWGGSYPGKLDDIVLFDRDLTAAEVAYLYNGPAANQIAAADRTPLQVDAGEDQILQLPQQSVQLQTVSSEPNTTYQWKLMSGPGEVYFNNANIANPVVSFGLIDKSKIHNTNYLHYTFKVYADNANRPGERDEVEVIFYDNDAPQSRTLSANPPPGIHPRILFAPEDLPEIRTRYFNSSYNQSASNQLQQLYDNTMLNSNSLDGLFYNSLLQNNNDISIFSFIQPNFKNELQGLGSFYSKLAGYAFISLMNEDTAELEQIATVFSNLTERHLTSYSPALPEWRNIDVNPSIGLCYDWLYNYMNDDQRTKARKLLSLQTKWRQVPGVNDTDERNSTNGYGYHSYVVINSLAIEGEEGYDPEVEKLTRRSLRRYMTQFGVMPSGYSHEGVGYHTFSMINAGPVIHALARRGENFYETTNFYANQKALFYTLMPGQDKLFGHGDTVEGLLGFCPGFVWQARYMFPNNKLIAKVSEALSDFQLTRPGSENHPLQTLIFGHEKITDTRTQAANDNNLPLTLFCPDKGYVNTRNDWSDEALMLHFRSGADKFELGHNHPDVNSFELFSHGVEWFSDIGKFSLHNDKHQTVLVDGIGGGGSTAAWTWPSLPGQFLNFIDNEYAVGGIGSAKHFYSYTHRNTTVVNELAGMTFDQVDAGTHGLTWADFAYEPDDALQDWRATPVNFQGANFLYTHNPMQCANRAAVLVKGEHPFVVIADDYQKDTQIRDYTWVANPRPGTLVVDSTGTDDLILSHTDNPNARLLVKIIQAEGLQSGPQLLEYPTDKFYLSATHTPVVIEARAVAPKFKILLYPHEAGDPLPEIEWNETANAAIVSIGTEATALEFTDDCSAAINVGNLCENPGLWSGNLADTDANGTPDYCDDPCTINSLADAKTLDAGTYTFDFGQGPFRAYVDGDGWVLWLQYHHSAGTNPALQTIPMGADLPIYDPSGLGTDNSLDLTKWGHGSQAFAASIPDASIRLKWFAETSVHNRVIHFESDVLGGFKANTSGTFADVVTNFNPMPDHTAFLPVEATNFWNNQGDLVLTEHPYYKAHQYHWSIKGLGSRWEVDNGGSTSYNHHTIHRVWVKGDGASDFMDSNSDGVCDNCINIQLQAWLEGVYDELSGAMTNTLSASRKLLPGQTPSSPLATPTPPGQPYHIAPWNYTGTEGINWTDTNYAGNETDWVLVSFRTGITKDTEVAQTAALIMQDGVIELVNRCPLSSSISDPLYIVLEHRNHIGIMTPQPVEIVNGILTYDFRTSDSYRDPTSFGQKQLPNGEWAMFAGDADQMDYPSFDVNGTDKTEWFDNNGVFDYYLSPDFNLDGDVNGQDKALWFENNGISSRVPK